MNKKLVALALVLLIAVSGLFAYTNPGPVYAYLQGSVGETLEHGFLDDLENDVTFDNSKTILNAFNTSNPPSFMYGYRTNAVGPIFFRMTVGDFLHTDGIHKVKISSVKVGSTNLTTMTKDIDNTYKLFNINIVEFDEDDFLSGKNKYTIIPATATGSDHLGNTIEAGEYIGTATAGVYLSTITITISAS
ncbi:hypothetical protein [Sphaerochaeta globosa]|uniref:Uncharacterized protein n=1 Tax=Sphaerochaeta globosa (strain ATCC BAA-1886 / DSM 22777 / Buddy) TaxID=158189 RepID=F0RZP3_SPHGB|nr:hypothetical protein [Sphaerochaeta globosa]ADY14794.1 hypothetical protein SpiBuddy_2987 [Sphaerochaeta globosa str. Buddy]